MANHRTDIKLGDLLVKMRSAGCYALFFGVESASAEVQASINKGLDIGGVVETAKSLSNIGMSATSSFILGFPDETPEQMSATIALGAELKLLGTDIVQFHRLRLWPPAAIAQSDLPNQFDRSSLEIEYPIQPPPEEDVQKIQMDPLFFSGYFVPNSKAGSPEQLAQAEMFFVHAVAVAPFTTAGLAAALGSDLITEYYKALSILGEIPRSAYHLDGDVGANWQAIYPFISSWLGICSCAAFWPRILLSILEYEDRRTRFVTTLGHDTGGCFAAGTGWAAYEANVCVLEACCRLRDHITLDLGLLQPSAYVLACSGDTYSVFAMDKGAISTARNFPRALDDVFA